MPIRSSLFALTVLASVCLPSLALADDDGHGHAASVTYYDTLSPYGDWVVTANCGRVWRPHRHVVGVNFVPYASGGRWVHTEQGWVFDSSWEWAWLPFHYGRWYEDDLDGWVWMPGDVWAPAWVEWRIGGGYTGWIPLGPPNHPRPHWYFVETQHFAEVDVWRHRSAEANEHHAMEVSVAVAPPPGIAFSRGPSVEVVRASSTVSITERQLKAPPPPLPRSVAVFPRDLPPAPPRAALPAAAAKPGSEQRGPQPAGKTELAPGKTERAPGKTELTPGKTERAPTPNPEPSRLTPQPATEAARPTPAPQPNKPGVPERRAEPVRPTPAPQPAAPERRPEPARPAVPQEAMPAAPDRRPEPMRPSPAQQQAQPAAPDHHPDTMRPTPAPRPVAPVARPPAMEQRQPTREPARPMAEPNMQRREPMQGQPPPGQQPAPAPVKRPQPQPQPAGPGAPAPGPRGGKEPRR